MLKFFRKIRQNLFIEGKTGRYFKYALGEIVLVVIGILIALQINNWNEERKQANKEQIVLNQLLSDFEANLNQLDQKIRVREDMMMSAKFILTYIDDKSIRNIDSLDKYLAKTMAYTTFDPIKVDLSSSGDLVLISDQSLKKALNDWSSDIIDVREDEYNWKDYRNNEYIPFIISEYQLRSLRNKAFKTNVLGQFSLKRDSGSNGYVDNEIGLSNHPVDIHELLDSPDFEDHISRCYSINSWTNSEALILRNRLLNILRLIKENLQDL